MTNFKKKLCYSYTIMHNYKENSIHIEYNWNINHIMK